jgi:adenosine deaminase
VESFIRGIPKTELHLHIEGTLEPDLMFALAARNGMSLRFESAEEVRRAYEFTDLQSFLDIYYESAQVLVHEQDFYDLTSAYLERDNADNVRHTEIFFDPQTHTNRGIAFETVFTGIHRALGEAETQWGMTSHLIPCFLRHLSADSALATLREALPFKSHIVAVGLDSSEAGHPPEKFVSVFDEARGAGFRTVAHAGEEGPPDYIRQALDLLKVSRIDHGVRCIEDDDLVERLARDDIPLTVCPLSNVRLHVFDTMENHNLKRLLDRGVRVTVNSDDPAYFGGYIGDNLLAAQAALGLSRNDVYGLTRNAIEAAFLEPDREEALLQELDEYVTG